MSTIKGANATVEIGCSTWTFNVSDYSFTQEPDVVEVPTVPTVRVGERDYPLDRWMDIPEGGLTRRQLKIARRLVRRLAEETAKLDQRRAPDMAKYVAMCEGEK
jgi:hypothetical protein